LRLAVARVSSRNIYIIWSERSNLFISSDFATEAIVYYRNLDGKLYEWKYETDYIPFSEREIKENTYCSDMVRFQFLMIFQQAEETIVRDGCGWLATHRKFIDN